MNKKKKYLIQLYLDMLTLYGQTLGKQQVGFATTKQELPTNSPTTFQITVDLKKKTIVYANGIGRCLGYSETISLSKFLTLMHPNVLEAFIIHEITIFTQLTLGYFPIEHYRLEMPLSCRGGGFRKFEKIYHPMSVDENGRLVSYTGVFSYTGKFNETLSPPLPPCFKNLRYEQEEQWNDKLLSLLKEVLFVAYIKPVDWRLIGLYAQKFPNQDILNKLNKNKGWMHDRNKIILEFGQRYLSHKFSSAKKLALYLLERGLIQQQLPQINSKERAFLIPLAKRLKKTPQDF